MIPQMTVVADLTRLTKRSLRFPVVVLVAIRADHVQVLCLPRHVPAPPGLPGMAAQGHSILWIVWCGYGVQQSREGVYNGHGQGMSPKKCPARYLHPQFEGLHRSVGVHIPNSRGHTEAWESVSPTRGDTPKRGGQRSPQTAS